MSHNVFFRFDNYDLLYKLKYLPQLLYPKIKKIIYI
jgi:hypothetical protein